MAMRNLLLTAALASVLAGGVLAGKSYAYVQPLQAVSQDDSKGHKGDRHKKGKDKDPVAAPEPSALLLTAMAAGSTFGMASFMRRKRAD